MTAGFVLSGILAAAQVASPPEPAPTDDPARAARLAKDRELLEKELHAIDAFGHVGELVDAARASRDGAGDAMWVHMSDGAVTTASLQQFVVWNATSDEQPQPLAVRTDRPNHPFPTIVDLNHQLRAHGIDFLFVVFPSRIQIYPELLISLPDAKGLRSISPGTTRFLLELNKEGVEVLDLAPLFAEHRFERLEDGTLGQLYLRNNQHWTPRGAELAAEAVAQRIRPFAWFEPGAAREGRDFLVDQFDYLHERITCKDGSPWQEDERFRVTRVLQPPNRPLDAKDIKSPIVMLGDSFLSYYWHVGSDFAAQLYRRIGRGIDLINPLNGAESMARDALRRRDDNLAGKKLLVWIMSEQELRPNPQWKPIPMFKP